MSAFRTPPRGLTRALARLPLWLYRLHLGWLLGGRFLRLTHTGRRSGKSRSTVLEVVDHDDETGCYYVAAGWGERAQWLRNVRATPRVEVTVGRRRFAAGARVLPADDAERVLQRYADDHRIAMRALGRLFGSNDPHELAQALPIVALDPASEG